MLITDLVNFYVKKFNASGISNSLEEIRLMIQEVLNIDLVSQLTEKELTINRSQEKLIKECSELEFSSYNDNLNTKKNNDITANKEMVEFRE